MHHFMSHTKAVLAETSDLPYIVHIWKQELPRLAFGREELLHMILALSALHRAAMETVGERAVFWRSVASGHLERVNDATTRKFRGDDLVGCTSVDDANGRYMLAWLRMLCCLVMQQTSSQVDPRPVDDFLEILEMGKGLQVHSQEQWYLLGQGPFAPIISRGFQVAVMPNSNIATAGLDIGLSHLDYMLDIEAMLPDDHAVCALALTELRELYSGLSQTQPAPVTIGLASILAWPKRDPSGTFADMIRRRVPQTLVILAYYGMLIDLLGSSRWWLRGIGARLLQGILLDLDEGWKQWIQLPAQSQATLPYNEMAAMSPGVQMGFEGMLI